jgi:hypothetical protein
MELGGLDVNFPEIFFRSLEVAQAKDPYAATFVWVGIGILNRFGARDWNWQDRYSVGK